MTDSAQPPNVQDLRFVRVVWCDNANVIRGKAFHTRFLAEHQERGVGIAMAQQAIPVMYDAIAPHSGLSPVGEVWLVPDWSTFAPLPYTPGHGRALGDMIHQGEPWALCPRGFLKRMIAQAEGLGLQVKAAFEHEFYLLRSTQPLLPVDTTVFASTLGMDMNHGVIDAITDALTLQGIPVERYYAESGHGQHELSMRYTHALQAADWQIVFRETVRGVALRHGLTASFLPKIFAQQAGSGCHLHFSLWQGDMNLLPAPQGLSPLAQAFVAGVLHHLPALMALTTPSCNSYRRLKPHFWSGAFRCWGWDNREAAVRLPSNPTTPSPTHIELKTVDASANPYLALGATIAAGLDGIQQRMTLGAAVAVDPGEWSIEEQQARGVDRLPTHLGDSIAHLKDDAVLIRALGSPLAQAFLAVRQAEWEFFKAMELDEEVNLLLERY
ncbi:MAG: glutamine synthetase [Leptolyngbyaceae cyanobacterium SL_7_1]|nr:glutamine synthetase [Leptolyngbyaceae cyanobacterium SL_7_1]